MNYYFFFEFFFVNFLIFIFEKAPIVITTFGDIITIPVIVLIVRLLLDNVAGWMRALTSLGICVWFAYAVFRLLQQKRDKFISVIVQRVPVLLCCMSLSFCSGIVMQEISTDESTKNFLLLV